MSMVIKGVSVIIGVLFLYGVGVATTLHIGEKMYCSNSTKCVDDGVVAASLFWPIALPIDGGVYLARKIIGSETK